MKMDTEKVEAYYGLPKEVQFCKKCVISNQQPQSVIEFKNKPADLKPTMEFDGNGVCTGCLYSEMKDNVIDWNEREKELWALCDKHRRKHGSYDCIVPSSGGKDSGFTAHILKYKYGMNPLTITWAPHEYTDIGWKNFQSLIQAGFDNFLYTPNGKVHRLLTKLAFEELVHPFQPFMIGQKLTGPRFSIQYGIPLVFYGENPAEYKGDINQNFNPIMSNSFFTGESSLERLYLSGVSGKELVEDYKIDIRDLNPYLPIEEEVLLKAGTEVHFLGYYLKWDPQENYYYAATNTGFQANQERTEGSYSKYSSVDDKIDWLHYYTTFIKFGIGRATYDALQEIRNKKITREEGVALVQRYDGEPVIKYFKDILAFLSLSEEKYWEIIDNARSPHLWKKENNNWILKHQVHNL
jgi:N-acetyl sugar amidotransferase